MRSTIEKALALDDAAASRVDHNARQALLTTLRDAKADYRARERALAMLVPHHAPLQYPDPEIDAALRELLRRPYNLNDLRPHRLPTAAAERMGGRCWDDLVAFAQPPEDNAYSNTHETLPALSRIALRESEPFRAKLRDLLAPELRESHGSLNAKLLPLWLLDLQELKPEIERIATSGPDDYEGTRATSSSGKEPVAHRFHLARQIAQLWNEEDLITRARLVVAFSLAHGSFPGTLENTLTVLRLRLEPIERALTVAQRDELKAFLAWCEEKAGSHLATPSSDAELRTIVATARAALRVGK